MLEGTHLGGDGDLPSSGKRGGFTVDAESRCEEGKAHSIVERIAAS